MADSVKPLPITIPDVAREKGRDVLLRAFGNELHAAVADKLAEAACLAMLRAWPGAHAEKGLAHFSTNRTAPVVHVATYNFILPFPPQENPNAE